MSYDYKALQSPWKDEPGPRIGLGTYDWYVFETRTEFVLGASSDGSGAYLSQKEAEVIAKALNKLYRGY